MNRTEVVAFARTLLGVKFKHMGRNGRDGRVGLDCGGVLACIADEFGYEYRDIIGSYSLYPTSKRRMRDLLDLFMDPTDTIRPATIALSRGIGQLSQPSDDGQHGFVFTETEPRVKILHADNSPTVAKVVEHGLTEAMRSSIICLYDFRGIED